MRKPETHVACINGVTRINIFEPTVLVAHFNSWTGARQRTKLIVPFANRLIVGSMDHISDGIEWRSEQQELSLWLFQQTGARDGPGLHGPPANDQHVSSLEHSPRNMLQVQPLRAPHARARRAPR